MFVAVLFCFSENFLIPFPLSAGFQKAFSDTKLSFLLSKKKISGENQLFHHESSERGIIISVKRMF